MTNDRIASARTLLDRIETEMRDNDGWTSLYEKDAIALCDALRESLDSLEGMRAERDALKMELRPFRMWASVEKSQTRPDILELRYQVDAKTFAMVGMRILEPAFSFVRAEFQKVWDTWKDAEDRPAKELARLFADVERHCAPLSSETETKP